MKQFIFILSPCLVLFLAQSASGQTSAADNQVSESVTYKEMPKGPAVYGIFEGRSPCGISRQMGAGMPDGCDHLKWQLILFRDAKTLEPTTYILTTEMFNRTPLKGKWNIGRGTPNDPKALVFALSYGRSGNVLYLYKGDENILFILDEKREFLAGDQDFSYTLNRLHKVLRPAP
ncbi:hypothetical protein BH09BAC6_BH09BAC6_06610 [soil metagenome]|jgi:hypothetical protein